MNQKSMQFFQKRKKSYFTTVFYFLGTLCFIDSFMQVGLSEEQKSSEKTEEISESDKTNSLMIPGVGNKKIIMWHPDQGTTAVLVTDHRVPLVSIKILLTGSAFSFYGSRERQAKRPEIQRKMQDLALDLNIQLSNGIRVSFLKEDMVPAIDLLREILYDPSPSNKTSKKIRAKKQIYIEAFDSPQTVLENHVDKIFCPPVNRSSIKLSSSKKDVSLPQPGNLRTQGRFIGFAGDLNEEEARKLLVRLQLPKVTPQKESQKQQIEKNPAIEFCHKPQGSNFEFFHPSLTQVHFSYARYYPNSFVSELTPEDIKLEIAKHIFSQRFTDSFLQTGEAYTASIIQDGLTYQIQTYAHVENALEFEKKLKTILETFAKDGISQEELDKAKQALRGKRAFLAQHPVRILTNILYNLKQKITPGQDYYIPEKAEAFSLIEVNQLIHHFFDPNKFVMIKLMPQKH